MRPSDKFFTTETRSEKVDCSSYPGQSLSERAAARIVRNILMESQCGFWSQWDIVGTSFASKTRGQSYDLSIIFMGLTKVWGTIREAEALGIIHLCLPVPISYF